MLIPKISIIIYTSRLDGLENAISSIISQNYKNYEIIVLDTSDTPLSYFSFQKVFYENKNILYIKTDSTEPIGKSYNTALEVSSGEYISFLTDTSTYTLNSLISLVKSIKGFDFAYGRIFTKDYTTNRPTYNNFSLLATLTKLLRRDDIHISSVLIKKEFLDKIGGFNPDIRRSYALDLWNRVLDKGKVIKVNEVIADVLVNVPEDLGKLPPIDLDLSNIFNREYPLMGYWSIQKTVSFNLATRYHDNLKNLINLGNKSWVASLNNFNSDVLITDTFSLALNSYQGTLLYYLDPTLPVNLELYTLCEGIISPVEYTDSKPVHVLKPAIEKKGITDADDFFAAYPLGLNIFCPDLHKSQDNVNFLKELIPSFYSNFKNIYIFHSNKVNVYYQIEGYENLHFIRVDLDNSDIAELKRRQFSCILSLNRNYNDYKNSYDLFLMSTKLKIPLISFDNFAFKNTLKNDKEIIIYENGVGVDIGFKKIQDLFYRNDLVNNARRTVYMDFIEFSVVNKLISFINSIFLP